MTDVMCPDCGWPVDNAKHDDVHQRMKRYDFYVDGVLFRAVLPWEKWPIEWQHWMRGLVAANSKYEVSCYYIDNYRPASEKEAAAIRYRVRTASLEVNRD
jgi:hypothetical protein